MQCLSLIALAALPAAAQAGRIRLGEQGGLVQFDRMQMLERWVSQALDGAGELEPASSDASMRRYWRLRQAGRSLIAMDAPPESGSLEAFVRLAAAFRARGLNTPEVLAADPVQGFALLTDLGSRRYLDVLDAGNADRYYGDAIAALVRLQAADPVPGLPEYDAAFLRRELALFDEWLLAGLLGLQPSAEQRVMLDRVRDLLVANVLQQPQVCVHRDFHSRNLMVTATASPGVLDFQDAVIGPISYDLVSLLKDCYIDWPRPRVEEWVERYVGLAIEAGVLRQEQRAQFLRWFDLMGAQRHLKAAGIFARLALRDGKAGYLKDLPRTLGYVVEVGERDAAIEPLAELIGKQVLPRLGAATARVS